MHSLNSGYPVLKFCGTLRGRPGKKKKRAKIIFSGAGNSSNPFPKKTFSSAMSGICCKAFDLRQIESVLRSHDKLLVEIYPSLWPKLISRLKDRMAAMTGQGKMNRSGRRKQHLTNLLNSITNCVISPLLLMHNLCQRRTEVFLSISQCPQCLSGILKMQGISFSKPFPGKQKYSPTVS